MDWQTRNTGAFLGEMVTVQVDRPIGYRHNDMIYPINYGFLPGVMGGDGEEQDAYILGVDEPVSSFTGRVIGVIRRHNDCEDKLVVAPEGKEYHQGEIAEAIRFQEQYFVSSIDCLKRKSCGVIPCRQQNGEVEILLVEQISKSWSLPKGHMEAGETETETALRELGEETGLRAVLNEKTRVTAEYPVGPKSRKEVVLFVGEICGDVKLREGEIENFRWVPVCKLHEYLLPDIVSCVEKAMAIFCSRIS